MGRENVGHYGWMAVFAIVLVCAVVVVSGCSAGSQASTSSGTSASSSAQKVGGWEVPAEVNAVLTDDHKAVYDAAAGTDDAVEPVALLATQVVSGLNYAFLGKDATGWSVLVCYKSIDGKSQITSTSSIDLDNVKTADTSVPEGVVGGWAVQVPEQAAELPQEAQAALTKALEGYTGINLVPIALLGTQVVAGTNYLFLCEGAAVTPDAAPGLYVVKVYEDLKGASEISSVEAFDLLGYIGN